MIGIRSMFCCMRAGYHAHKCRPGLSAKNATLIGRLPTADLRREWRRRIVAHDGHAPGTRGVARWLKLAEGVGLNPAYVEPARIPPGAFVPEGMQHAVAAA
jgi:hypothetical protein